MTAALEGGEWSAARPGRTLPPGKTRYPFYRRLGGLQGQSGRGENLVPTGIQSRTVQPVVSRYTDWATGPTFITEYYSQSICIVNLEVILGVTHSNIQDESIFINSFAFFVNNQLVAQFFFFYLFILILYMFRATKCSSSGESIVSIWPLVYVSLCRWPWGM